MEKLALKRSVRKFVKDEKGAAMIEYSVLIGLVTAAVIGVVISVGDWVNTQWSDLNTKIN